MYVTIYHYILEIKKASPNYSHLLLDMTPMNSPQRLDQPMSRINFRGPKDARATEVLLHYGKENNKNKNNGSSPAFVIGALRVKQYLELQGQLRRRLAKISHVPDLCLTGLIIYSLNRAI